MSGARQVKGIDVAVFADCFNRYFEPDNVHAVMDVLSAGERQVCLLNPSDGNRRPLCCGRTFLSMGLVDQAVVEAKRFVDAAVEYIESGVPIVGLEPSCILSLREDMLELLPSGSNFKDKILLIEEYISGIGNGNPVELEFISVGDHKIFVHGHCHQKAAGMMDPTLNLLKKIPGSTIEVIDSGCCGMAGAFGYQIKTSKVADKVGELDFLPKKQVIEFIKDRFNRSLESVGVAKIFSTDDSLVNQTEWFNDEIIGTKHGDFFVKRSINYSKRTQSITGEDIF